MAPKRRKFQRPIARLNYRKLFVIAVEGMKTEPQYFFIFNSHQSVIHVNCLKGRHDSAPPKVLKRMEDYLQKQVLRRSDEAWLVVDKDQWPDEQLATLVKWSQTKENYGFALSNPSFEYWLLLHFETGDGVSSKSDCLARLKQHIPTYDKGIDAKIFTNARIRDAIKNAKLRDSPPCLDWPRTPGCTTVYKLVERIVGKGGNS